MADAPHELKTPLTIVTANAELLQERYAGISVEADKWIEHVSQEYRETRSLVGNLLLLTRNDSCIPGKGGFTRFGLSDLVMEKILIFEPVFYQEEKTLECKVEDDVMMMGNPSRMEQLIRALMDNVVKCSVLRGRTGVRLEPAGRNRVRPWVCSQEELIPKDKRTLIFRRFYRDDSARNSTNGYGLGLAITAEIARSHRARIGVEYRDEMNCFYVTVRRKRA